ncbi:MAG TPA: GIY-YIG nuclease family protein [Patescibacteria group bacterium]|nr:GIY-YIG nuclease family protein [Patescibacteria group bacterium]
MKSSKKWYVYIVQCSDESLYTGISPDVNARLKKHNLGLGAKAIRGKLPVKLVYQELYNNQIAAAAREREIKSWHRKYKLKLIETANQGK